MYLYLMRLKYLVLSRSLSNSYPVRFNRWNTKLGVERTLVYLVANGRSKLRAPESLDSINSSSERATCPEMSCVTFTMHFNDTNYIWDFEKEL
jgi:hypothetical protein